MPTPASTSPAPKRDARPLLRLVGLGAAAVVAALAVAWLTRTLVQHGDWSTGAMGAGTTALLLGALALVAGVAWYFLRRRVVSTLLIAAAVTGILFASGGGLIAGAGSLHSTQAHYSEARGLWSDAIVEYAHTGEAAPNAPNIARVYDEWGEQLLRDHSYSAAVARFNTVINDYGESSDAVARATSDLYQAYRAWMRADAASVSYDGAIDSFTDYLSKASCTADCRAEIPTLLAQAHFEYGEQLADQTRYTDAVVQFELVQAQYAQSSYAAPAHVAAAGSYYALGQQQIASAATCTNAVKTYNTLLTHYGDQPEAARARTAMAAPQNVTGTFKGFPKNPLPVVHLSKSAAISGLTFSNDFTAQLDATTGVFTFTQVPHGSYILSTARDLHSSVNITYYTTPKGNLYTVKVGPLCATQLGTVAY
jgi:tetratricopeptide (TPR) repeat protein